MKYAVIAAVAGAALATTANANLFADPSFESPITFDGPPFVGSWEGFNSGPAAGAGNNTVFPRTGPSHVELNITAASNQFAGLFQDVPVMAGSEYVYSGFHATPSNPLDVGIEIRIEWRDSGTDSEVARVQIETGPSGSAYEAFSLTAMAPAGADTARVVYAMQSFVNIGSNTGVVYLDDFSFIPAPGSLAILAGAGLGLTRRRR